MVLLGLALLIIGLLLGLTFLWIIGVVLMILGLVGWGTGHRVY